MGKEIKKISHEGKIYYTIPDAGRYLGTTATKVRQLMGEHKIEWMQVRINGKLLVSADSLIAYKYSASK